MILNDIDAEWAGSDQRSSPIRAVGKLRKVSILCLFRSNEERLPVLHGMRMAKDNGTMVNQVTSHCGNMGFLQRHVA